MSAGEALDSPFLADSLLEGEKAKGVMDKMLAWRNGDKREGPLRHEMGKKERKKYDEARKKEAKRQNKADKLKKTQALARAREGR